MFSFLGEVCAIFYTFFIGYLIRYIKDTEAPWQEGALYCGIFISATLASTILRNQNFFLGYNMALDFRKCLVGSMYDKVSKLSMKSLTETNSGKLITIVSADLFQIERPISIIPMIFIAPILNLICYGVVAYSAGWIYAVFCAVIWFIMLLCQWLVSRTIKGNKIAEGACNDQRMKLVNDMVAGIRTIKSYAWESHYLKKIMQARSKQLKYVFILNTIGSLGFTVFQNFGLIAAILIFVPMWYQGIPITEELAFSLLAMLYFIFSSVNSFVFMGYSTLMQLLAIIDRVSQVISMEEYKSERDTKVPYEQVGIDLDEISYSWGFRVKDSGETKGKAAKAQIEVEQVLDPVVRDVTLKMEKNDLTCVIGKIGSGKTSLLHGLMDETVKCGGKSSVRGRISYVE
jgi:ABC-type multidrug transport system fused ATPase/permease subunit